MSCEHYELQIIMRAEGELPAAEEPGLRAHLGTCAGCRTFAQDLEVGRADLAVLEPADPGEAFFHTARERIWREHQEARRAPKSVGARLRTWWEDLRGSLAPNRRALAGVAAAVAAAAVLAVLLWPKSSHRSPLPRPSPTVARAPAASPGPTQADALLEKELNSLSGDELKALSSRVRVDVGNGSEYEEMDDVEDAESLHREIDSLTSEELRAFDAEVSRALRATKGA